MDPRLIILICILLAVLVVPLLTGGSPNHSAINENNFTSENDKRILKPVVSQTCVSIPSFQQMLPVDPESVPGKMPTVWPSDNLHYFDNTELVTKLCGPGITSESLNQWKNVEQHWQEMYSEKALQPKNVKFNDEGANLRKVKF
jgi:hypothetical protein